MIGALISPLAVVAEKIIDQVFTSGEEKAAAKLKFATLSQAGHLKELEQSLSAILTEAQSNDPWTSRARPAFLYVMYSAITLCFVGGILGIWWPEHTLQAAVNINAMLSAIPDDMWWLFGAGYLGYSGVRSYDKRTLKGGSR